MPEKSELLKYLDYKIMDLIDEEDLDRINSEVVSLSKQTEDINGDLVKILNLSKQNRTETLPSPSHSDISLIGSHNLTSTTVERL